MKFATSGTTSDGFVTTKLKGDISYKYLFYDEEKGYLMGHESNTTYDNGFYTYSGTNSDVYWSNEVSEREWVEIGKETIDTIYGPMECTVAEYKEGNSVETQWWNGWITYKMTYVSKTYSLFFQESSSITYELTDVFTFENKSEYDVSIYADKGISVTGYGTHDAYQSVTLTAEIDSTKTSGFAGWYNENGNLLSREKTYTVDVLLADTKVYALNVENPDYSLKDGEALPLETSIPLTETVWEIHDEYDNVIKIIDRESYIFESAGYYDIYYSGKDSEGNIYNGYFTLFADGASVKVFEWEFDGKKETYSIEIDYSDFRYYRDSKISREFEYPQYMMNYITTDDEYIIKIAEDFLKRTEGMTEDHAVQYVLEFVQNIEYQSDSTYMGANEYWKFPLETLYDQGGDCEDTSILFSSILSLMGYDSALFMFPGHMAAGVNLDMTIPNASTIVDDAGNLYYFCETTSTGYDVGDNPNKSAYNQKTLTSGIVVKSVSN